MTTFSFKHYLVDVGLPDALYAQTALADLDNDGRLEYVTGQRTGDIFWLKRHGPGKWTRPLLGTDSPSDVGACALDVDGDFDVFSCEMEAVGGDEAPRYYIWENVDGRGGA